MFNRAALAVQRTTPPYPPHTQPNEKATSTVPIYIYIYTLLIIHRSPPCC